MWPTLTLTTAIAALLATSSVSAAALPADLAPHLAPRAVSASSWANLGCVSDGGARLLSTNIYTGNLNSQDYCVDRCASAGYKYAGVQYGTQCWCGNGLNNGQGAVKPQSSCSMACPGNGNQKCGAGYLMNLFANPSTLTSDGCYTDTNPHVLQGLASSSNSMTPLQCVNLCGANGYAYAGLEYGVQCYCGSSKPTKQVADSQCSMACGGASGSKCGAGWLLNLYSLGGAAKGGSASAPATTTTTTTAKPTTTTTTATVPTTPANFPVLVGSNAANNAVYGSPKNGPSSGTKYLWAHFMLGNTYTYTKTDWTNTINQAKSAGFDGFAVNMGRDSWQPARVADGYSVAASLGFKLFFSFDMTSMACGSAGDAATLANLVKTYASNPAQAKYGGKVLVSTFAGENCNFGQGSTQNGWNYFRSLVTAGGVSMYFIPAHFSDVSTFAAANWFDGVFNWNGGWPMDNSPISTASDDRYLSALGSKGYMAAVSPWFFTYYGPNTYNKNWIYRSDDWLLAARFEELVANRNKYDMAEFIAWNDFGESTYIGTLAPASDQPMSTGWTNGMPHTGLLSLINVYAKAFKTGSYGSFGDKLWLWTRPHPKGATATNPTLARPNHYDWSQDNLYVVVTLASPATVKIESGSNFASWNLPAGLTKLSVASNTGAVKASIVRNGATAKSYDSTGQFSYTSSPRDYNFNYFVAEA